MGKKYIIELLDDCPSEFKGIIVFGLTPTGQISAEPIPVEDLTSYAEPDLEHVRKEAYEAGAKNSAIVIADDKAHEAYQHGLADAWEAARKIAKLDSAEQKRIYGGFGIYYIAHEFSAHEAIDKIRQYEQEQEYCVGDEFENGAGQKFVVLKMDGKEIDRYIDGDGKAYVMAAKYRVIRKTGRHFPEIAAVLEKMRGEQE